MSREFTMGIRLNYFDNDFTRGIREATRNTNSFRDGMAAATRSATGLTSAVGAAAVALGGMVAAKKGFDWLVGANADMETYQNTLTVVMGSAEEATKTLAWANKFATQTPFEIPQIVEATTKMASYGISAQKTLGVVGDMASVMGKDLMQAVEAVADAQTGEVERLKEFGITKGMIQEQAKLLGSNPIDSKGSITDMQGFNAALFSLMEKRFQGGMAMQAKSFKGMLSNASDFMGSLGRNLGKPLFDRSKKQLEGFLNTLNQLQNDGSIDHFIGKVHKVGAVVGNEMAYAGKVLRAAFRGMWAIASPIINGIRSNWAKWQPVIQTLGYSLAAFAVGLGGLKTALTTASIAMKLLNVTMLTNPVGWIILGVGLLIGLFIKMNGGIDGSKKKLLEIWDVTKHFGQAIADIFTKSDPTRLMDMGFSRNFNVAVWKVVTAARFMADQLAKGWAWIQQQAIKYWPTIKSTAITVINSLVAAFSWLQSQAIKYWPMIKAAIVTSFDYVKANVLPVLTQLLTVGKNTFMQLWAVIKPFGMTLYNLFKAVLPTVIPVILGLVKGAAWAFSNILWPAILIIGKAITSMVGAVLPVVMSVVTGIIKAFTAVLNWAAVIWPAVVKVAGAAFVFLQFWWAAMGPYIMAALQVITSIIVGAFKVIMAVIKFIWTTISSIISTAWAIISGIIQTALGLLTGDWKMAWDGIKTIFEGIWNGIIDFLGGLGSLFYDSGKAIITTLVDGIKSMAMAPVNAIKGVMEKVREFLPFSDAKKGPLSQLTYSGGAIMTTLSAGVDMKAGMLQDAVGGAFSNAGTNITPNQVNAVVAPPAKAEALAPVFNIGDININAAEGMDGKQLYQEFINELYNQAKNATALLSSSNKAALI
ncbi:hypothetical protein M5X11_17520 [Paenibacillus alginolyticus]|uniref:hypothetical protein n=1 Tax=Paenibacillus alginolyticus TaxID=59839 RepID=UPI00042A542F|nr:hypothetical protein [Paenibacillus alginolyticus]MCY9666705.1 hypothetical protein [Paenibacillus alginolyticus]